MLTKKDIARYKMAKEKIKRIEELISESGGIAIDEVIEELYDARDEMAGEEAE